MTVSEMHIEFQVGYDKIDSFNSKTYTPEEIDIFLNNAQQIVLSQCTKDGLESNQTLRDYLRGITVNANLTTFISNADNKPNGSFIQLPSDYRITLNEECSISYTDCNSIVKTKRVLVTPTTHDKYYKVVDNPFTTPYLDNVVQLPCSTLSLNNAVELITDGTYTITIYHLRYMRNPQLIQYGSQYVTVLPDQDCELSTQQSQKEVVSIAVLLALGKLENNSRYNTQSVEIREIKQ